MSKPTPTLPTQQYAFDPKQVIDLDGVLIAHCPQKDFAALIVKAGRK